MSRVRVKVPPMVTLLASLGLLLLASGVTVGVWAVFGPALGVASLLVAAGVELLFVSFDLGGGDR